MKTLVKAVVNAIIDLVMALLVKKGCDSCGE